MQFSTGQVLVHPYHGPVRVEGTTTRVVAGVERRYLNLRVRGSDLSVSVPADAAEQVGLRPVLSREEFQEVLAELRAASLPFDRQFSRRMKNQQDRLLQGDLVVTAGVVRDLLRRDLADGLSPAEKDLFRRAQEPLLGELEESLDVSPDRAEQLLLATVSGQDAAAEAPSRAERVDAR